MSRNNGTFRYRNSAQQKKDVNTGFYTQNSVADWIDGCECYLERLVPAHQIIGTDGKSYSYTHDMFIPKRFSGELLIGTEIEFKSENNQSIVFTISGIDNTNRKYIEIYGN